MWNEFVGIALSEEIDMVVLFDGSLRRCDFTLVEETGCFGRIELAHCASEGADWAAWSRSVGVRRRGYARGGK